MQHEIDRAAAALRQLAAWRADDRSSWIKIGMALHSVGVECAAWEQWSRQSSKYAPGECERVWAGFKDNGGVGIGTLLAWAKEDRAIDPSPPPPAVASTLPHLTPDELAEIDRRFLPGQTAKCPARPAIPFDLRPLARSLGVTTDALVRLGVYRDGSLWIIPEHDAHGGIAGYATRDDDGRKGFVAGGKRGLTLRWPMPPDAGVSKDCPILVVEGMSDASAGLDLGYAAIGRPSAAGGNDLLGPLVRNRHVIIVGENDAGAGRLGAEKCSSELVGCAASVRVVYPPSEFKDLREWKNATQLSRDGFAAYVAAHATTSVLGPATASPVVIQASDVVTEPLQWAWRHRFPLGSLSVVAGPGGLGKTTAMLDIVARSTSGRPGPDGAALVAGAALIVSAEDDIGHTLVPRLKAAGANLERIAFLQGIRERGHVGWLDLQKHLSQLEQAIRGMADCRWVLIDPITAYCGRIDGNSNTDVRGVLGPLSELSSRTGVAVVGITHLTKSGDGSVANRVLGSVAFTAAARSVYAVGPDKNDVTRRLFLPAKTNLAPSGIHGLAFSIVPSEIPDIPKIIWDSVPVATPADEAFAFEPSRRGPEPAELKRAIAYLKVALAAGPRPTKEVEEEGRESEDIDKRTLERARRALGVTSFKSENKWWIQLPDQDEHPAR
jgi:hypothetical protein